MYPTYSFPPRNVAGLIVDWLLARRRSFREDALDCVGRMNPSLHGFGEENIPQAGPCVVTFNHYFRPNFSAIWMPLAIAATIPVEMHFVMTGELTYPGKWYAPLGRFLSKIVLARAARVYGFTTMPPMPPRQNDVESRARSVRRVLDDLVTTQSWPCTVIGLASGVTGWVPKTRAEGAGMYTRKHVDKYTCPCNPCTPLLQPFLSTSV